MTTKIKHLAIVSSNYAIEEKFYQAVFGMKTAERARIESASVVSDGYVGHQHQPAPARPPGRVGPLRLRGGRRRGRGRAHGREVPEGAHPQTAEQPPVRRR